MNPNVPFAALVLPLLMGMVIIVAANHLGLWLARRRARVHLWWTRWTFFALFFLAGRHLQHVAMTAEVAELATRLQFVSGLFLMGCLLGMAYECTGRLLSRSQVLTGGQALALVVEQSSGTGIIW